MIDTVLQYLPMLLGVPQVGPILVMGIKALLGLGAVVTALVACWHAVIQVLQAASKIPGCSALQKEADALKADEDALQAKESLIMSILDRLSLIKLPS